MLSCPEGRGQAGWCLGRAGLLNVEVCLHRPEMTLQPPCGRSSIPRQASGSTQRK